MRERTVALIAAAAAATRTIAGTIRKPIESARSAKAMAAAKKVTADAAAASAPIRAIRDSLLELDRSRRAYHPNPPTMFIGHFGLAFGAKRIAPTVSLGLLFAACQLADLLWPTLLLLGIERVIIEPGNTVVTPLDFVSYPYSHSLLTLGILGMSLGGAYMGLRRAPAAAGATLFLLVLSHWLLDVLTHRPDMPLTPTSRTHVGLGLWNSFWGTVVVEGLLFAVGLAQYLRTTRARSRGGAIVLWSLVAFMVIIYAGNLFSPPPPSATMVAWAAQALWLLVAWAWWADRWRSVDGNARSESRRVYQ